MSQPPKIFDRALLRRRLHRAAADWQAHNFLRREMVDRLADRLLDIDRTFGTAVELDARDDLLANHPAVQRRVQQLQLLAPVARFGTAVQGGPQLPLTGSMNAPLMAVADSELLPLAAASQDAILAASGLHVLNDLPGSLVQIRRSLRPDGLFLGAMLGGESLIELRQAMMDAELEIEGGVSPRVAPSVEIRDLGGLLQRAGFALPVVDTDRLTVTYNDVFALFADLRGMAETNVLVVRRRTFSRRQTFARMADIYQERFAAADGRLSVTFELLFMTAWAPGDGQQKPLQPGSGQTPLGAVLT